MWRINQLRLSSHQSLIRYQEATFWLKLWKSSEEYAFLREVHSQPLQQTLKDLDRAYRDGFDKSQPLKRLPHKKRKYQDTAFRYLQGVKLDNRRIYLPKIGWVGFYQSILDQGWGEFHRQLEYKSQWRGGMVVAMPPHHTSQNCSVCGHVHPDNRPRRDLFHCRACGHTEHADTNAAKNIRARGHRVLACGGNGVAHPMKQEPVGNRKGVPPAASSEAVGIPVL